MTGGPRPGPRALLVQDRSRATRRRLVDAATQRWTASGYDRVSVAEVCATAGVAKGSFYFHFRSKEDLVVELLTTALDDATSDAAASPGGAPLHDLAAAVAERLAPLPRALTARAAAEALRVGAGDGDGARWATTIAAHLPGTGTGTGTATADTGAVAAAVALDAIRSWAATDTRIRSRGLTATLVARLGLITRGPAARPGQGQPRGRRSERTDAPSAPSAPGPRPEPKT